MSAPARCRWLCQTLVEAPLSEPFRAPYRSEQYAKIISEAVDLQSLLAYTSQTPFVVEEFRRRLRLLWRNAKTFNPVGDPIHNAACILETFTETEMDRILADSANKTPRDVSRFCTVCWPFLARLREDDVGALFESYECSMLAEEWTDFVWKVPRPIFLKTIAESFEGYVHGDDLFADVCRVFQNVIIHRGADHPLGAQARHMLELACRLWTNFAPDLAKETFVTSTMRDSLRTKLEALCDRRRRAWLVDELKLLCADAVDTRADGITAVFLNALSLTHFVMFDRKLRQASVSTRSLPTLVGVAGQARMGKDTVGRHLARRLRLEPRSFARGVKDLVASTFGVTAEFIEKWKPVTDRPAPGFDVPMRRVLQTVGDGLRTCRADVWVHQALSESMEGVFCDLRYENEIRTIRSKGGVTILVARSAALNHDTNPHLRPVLDWFLQKTSGTTGPCAYPVSDFDNVPAEAAVFDWFIRNDGAALDELVAAVDRMCGRM